jgi:hypothetical protein
MGGATAPIDLLGSDRRTIEKRLGISDETDKRDNPQKP